MYIAVQVEKLHYADILGLFPPRSFLGFSFSMSVNSTLPAAGYVATVLDSTQNYIANSPGRAILLAVVYSPLIAIILNVLRQLVCVQ